MGLALYTSEEDLASSGDFSNPVRTYHDGKNGSAYSVMFYVRNDDSALYYESVVVEAVDSTGPDDTIGEYGSGYSVKLVQTEIEPLPHEWNQIASGNSIEIDNIGTDEEADTLTFYPIYLRVNCPGNVSVQIKKDIKLRLSAVARPVE